MKVTKLFQHLALRMSYPQLICAWMLMLGLCLSAAANTTLPTYPDVFHDWVYAPATTSVCAGYYLPPQPLAVGSITDNPPLDIHADHGSLALQGNSLLTGHVVVERGDMRLTAEQLTFYRDPQTQQITSATAAGQVLIEKPQIRLYGAAAHLDLSAERIDLQTTQFRIYSAHARGTANSLILQRDQPLYLHDVSYTSCAPDSNVWAVQAKSVMLNQTENRGIARNAWIYVKDVPIAYTPYISFPLSRERKSGLLNPSYASSNSTGLEFSLPYYFNLAPNYDVTVTPVWYSKRSYQTQLENRYLFEKMQGMLYAEWLPHDPEFAAFRQTNLAGITDFTDPQTRALKDASTDRRALYWKQKSQFSAQGLVDINFEYVSDDHYIADLNPTYFDLNNRSLERQLETHYFGQYWSFYGRMLDYQNLQPLNASLQESSYGVLPQLMLYGEYPARPLGLRYSLNTEATIFTQADKTVSAKKVTRGNRYGLTPQIDWHWQTPYAYFTPKVQLAQTNYALTINNDPMYADSPMQPTRTVPIYNLDGGLFFDRNINLFGSSFSQSLEPRWFYLRVPYQDQNALPNFDSELMEFNYAQLFRVNRFTGTDRIGDANQLSYALTSRFTNNTSGEERSRLSLGQIYYFTQRKVTACDQDISPNCIADEDPFFSDSYSPFVSEYYYKFNKNWAGLIELQWNPYTVTSLEQRRLQVNYHENNNFLFNIGYSFIYQGNPLSAEPEGSSKNNLEQTDAAVSWRVHPRWNLLAGIEYDITNHFAVENFAGVEYENCCWAVRFGARRYLTINSSDVHQEFDDELFIQWSFKGLANVGNSPTNLFGSNLLNYQDTFGQRY